MRRAMRRGLSGGRGCTRGGLWDRVGKRLPFARLALAGATLLIGAALFGPAPSLLAQEPGGTAETDRAALLALYAATDGPNWRDNANWSSDAPLDTWHGVTTNDHGRVIRLSLSQNSLRGTLPPELGTLDALTVLALGDNALRGPIPAALSNLADLALLILWDNGLTGPIPATLGTLANLRVTRFAGNALTGCVPHGLRYLLAAPQYAPDVPAHDFLAVDVNGDGDIDDAGDLHGLGLPFCMLHELRLSGVTLDPPFAAGRAAYSASVIRSTEETVVTATPHNAGDRVTIRKGEESYASGEAVPLDLGPNPITIEVVPPDATPKQTFTMAVTRRLNDDILLVDPGRLSPAFSSTGDLYTVHVTNQVARITIEGRADGGGRVAYRDESGTAITDADASAAGLQLDLPEVGGRRIHVVMSAVDGGAGARTYEMLAIREGTVETDRTALLALQEAVVGANRRISTNWGSTEPLGTWSGVYTNASGRVTRLALEGRLLAGPLPAELGHLDHLTDLSLGGNELSGPIPAALGNLARLRKLNLSHNRLDGPIPALRSLPDLTYLNLRGNRLSGPIPSSLGRLAHLSNLFLDNNQLSGPIPAALDRLADLRNLFLDNNQLHGPLPALSGLPKLTYLNLGHNRLRGPIPAALGRHASLREVALAGNRLSGPLPDLSGLPKLTYLNLGHNRLRGPIPAALGRHADLRELALAGNQLIGPLPDSLGDLARLRVTRFAGNALTGCVPFGLRHLLAAPANALGVPAHDFIAVDANGDGDSADAGDTPGLGLPFCLLRELHLRDATLDPSFASGRAAYAAAMAADAMETVMTATAHDAGDALTIRKGEESYASGEALPLDPGPNPITIAVVPPDGTPTQIVTVTVTREAGEPPAPGGVTLTLRKGGNFYALPAGAPTTAARLFADTDVASVWKYNRATGAWDLAYLPDLGREDFAIAGGDVLWIVSPRAQTVGN